MLDSTQAKFLLLLRLLLGRLFLYAGISKIVDSDWTAAGYSTNSKTFSGFYQWLASPENIGWVNFLNEWGAVLIGISLILRLGVRLSSILSVTLMLAYYFPIIDRPGRN